MELVLYERAKTALAEAHRVDEVKEIRDRAEAAAAYARQAKDSEMIRWATEIKVRAERRAGEMLREMAARGERAMRTDGSKFGGNGRPLAGSSGRPANTPVRLADMGVTKDQSSRWQALAAMPAEHFETAVETAKHVSGEVSAAFVLRQHKEGTDEVVVKRRAPGPKTKVGKQRLEALKQAATVPYVVASMRACLKAIRENPDAAAGEPELIDELLAELAGIREQASARLTQAA